jgi:ATP-dependent DNA helicase RecG
MSATRPPLLAPLFATVLSLKGVGPKVEALLNKLVGQRSSHARIIDLLWHLPVGVINRTITPRFADARIGELATLEVTVTEHRSGGGRRGGRAPYKVLVEDSAGAALELVYFNADPGYLKRLLPVGSRRLVSGKLESYDGWLQIPHPNHVVDIEGERDATAALPMHEPVYPLTAGLTNTTLRKAIGEALATLPTFPEWMDEGYRAKNAWSSFADALRRLHAPEGEADLLPSAPARARLAHDELLANQLALAVIRARLKRRSGRKLAAPGKLRKAIVSALPFVLTGAQKRALVEIDADLASPHRMLRLLQGDVGSGKTVVALLAMATAVEAGAQAALMAPTELLARQHLKTITEFGAPSALRIALLTGRERGRERAAIVEGLANGNIDILIGTHALFQEHVAFRDLGLVVIDEQHRFGVHQRLGLQEKGSGSGAELLVMTATPIPRTLLLTSYGDMDVSRLDEKPLGRKPVATRTVRAHRRGD